MAAGAGTSQSASPEAVPSNSIRTGRHTYLSITCPACSSRNTKPSSTKSLRLPPSPSSTPFLLSSSSFQLLASSQVDINSDRVCNNDDNYDGDDRCFLAHLDRLRHIDQETHTHETSNRPGGIFRRFRLETRQEDERKEEKGRQALSQPSVASAARRGDLDKKRRKHICFRQETPALQSAYLSVSVSLCPCIPLARCYLLPGTGVRSFNPPPHSFHSLNEQPLYRNGV